MLALKWHPDKNKHEEACEKFKKINKKFQTKNHKLKG